MLNISQNHQVIYSLNTLSQALYQLMQDQPFEEITITQICQTAQITRRTFYRNCSTKLDLVEHLLQQRIRKLLDSVDFTSTDLPLLYRNFFQYWQADAELLSTLYRHQLFSHFTQVFTKYCIRWMEDRLMLIMLQNRSNQDTLRHFYNSFIIGGLCSMLESWTAENFCTPIDDLVYVLTMLAPKE